LPTSPAARAYRDMAIERHGGGVGMAVERRRRTGAVRRSGGRIDRQHRNGAMSQVIASGKIRVTTAARRADSVDGEAGRVPGCSRAAPPGRTWGPTRCEAVKRTVNSLIRLDDPPGRAASRAMRGAHLPQSRCRGLPMPLRSLRSRCDPWLGRTSSRLRPSPQPRRAAAGDSEVRLRGAHRCQHRDGQEQKPLRQTQ
jgi:hypothetical protein